MRRLLWSQLRHRRGRAAALGLAILVAAASFTLLTASARTSTIQVRHTLTRNFRGAYDILVRPRDSYTPLEREQGLVRDNYLSGIYGGITRKQYIAIRRIPGVEVAAPIANIGTVLPAGRVTLPLQQFVTGARDRLLRVHFSWKAERGLSHYPGGDVYVYLTDRRFFLWPSPTPYAKTVVTDGARPQPLPICDGFGSSRPTELAPFRPVNSQYFSCFSTDLDPVLVKTERPYGVEQLRARNAKISFFFYFPVVLAAIDPVQESKLVHLDRAIVSGRYLRANELPRHGRNTLHTLLVPAIASSRTFLDEQLVATVQPLHVPSGTDLPATLAAGACGVSTYPCDPTKVVGGPPGHPRLNAYRFIRRLAPGSVLERRVYSAGDAYGQAVRGPGTAAYWTSAPVRYRRLGPDELEPTPVDNPDETWLNDFSGDSSYYDQPTDNRDLQFRRLSERTGSNASGGGSQFAPAIRTVGRFDPNRLPGFSPLSRIPLETYYPPKLVGADARSRALLHGKPLLPSQNVGGYAAEPPLLLTTLAGIRPFLDNSRWNNLSSRQQRAPISVVRVRVAGVKGPDKLSQQRIKIVAQLIHEQTGLAVDVTAGSSPTPVTVALPQGKFGRPALVLREGWVKKGVAVTYLRALDRKDLALFALILVVCVLFLGNGAFAAVRVRRGEIGALSTLGWSPREVFVAVLGELAVVGVVAGVVGTGLAAALVHWLSLDFPLLRTLYVLPIAVVLALAAGLVPAWRAARGRPLDAIRPPVTGARSAHRVHGIPTMALVNLGRLPGRTLVGAAGLVLGVAALTVMVGIERDFSGTLVGTLLGDAISVQVRQADFVALGLTLALSALSAADVLHLNLRERRGELVTLRTLGWSDGEVRRLVALEALVLTAGASLVGAGIGVLVGAVVLGVGLAPLAIAAVVAGGSAALAAFAASLLPVGRLHRLSAPEVLAAE
jgi:putative ABC transport system permease protein